MSLQTLSLDSRVDGILHPGFVPPLMILEAYFAVYEGKTGFKQNKTMDSFCMSILREDLDGDYPEDDSKARSLLCRDTRDEFPLTIRYCYPHWKLTTTAYFSDGLQSTRSPPPRSLAILQGTSLPCPFISRSPTSLSTQAGAPTGFHFSPPNHYPELLLSRLELINKTFGKDMCKLPDALRSKTWDRTMPRPHSTIRLSSSTAPVS